MTVTAYSRSVELFDALMRAPAEDAHASPASLIQAANIPSSSGYRHVATLEAEGFLRRDSNGTYLVGNSAIRSGFSGFGLGSFSPIAQPVLLRLRQATQHTAFLAIIHDLDLHMGPYTVGRETRNVRLHSEYGFETIPDLTADIPVEITLRSQKDQVIRRTSTLMAPVLTSHDTMVVLGLILNLGWSSVDHLRGPLRGACDQITSAINEL